MTKRFTKPRPIGQSSIKEKGLGQKGSLRFSLRLAEVTRIDYERYICDIKFLQAGQEVAREVPLSSAYWSARGFLGAMPEEGSIALIGFSASHMDQGIQPFIVSFLPNGIITAKNFAPFGIIERQDSEIAQESTKGLFTRYAGTYGVTRHKMRKIYPGDVFAMSAKGSELVLDRGISLQDADGQGLQLLDQNMSLNGLTLTSALGGIVTKAGRVLRSDLLLPTDSVFTQDRQLSTGDSRFAYWLEQGVIDDQGNLAPDVNVQPYRTREDLTREGWVTRGDVSPQSPAVRSYTEATTRIFEFVEALTEDDPQPLIDLSMGTVVGQDAFTQEGRLLYGKLSKPMVFNSPSDTKGNPRLEPLSATPSQAELSLATTFLYQLTRPDGLGKLFIAHDREGHVQMSIPASTSKQSNLGGGRSLDADLKGSFKLTAGQNQARESFDLYGQGGMKISLGSLPTSRSIDAFYRGGVRIQIQKADLNGRGLDFTAQGQGQVLFKGSVSLASQADVSLQATGSLLATAQGFTYTVGQGGWFTNNVGDQVTITGGTQETTIGRGSKTTIASPLPANTNALETEILVGGELKTFTAPAQQTTRFLSSGTTTLESPGPLAINRQSATNLTYSLTAPSGSYSVNLATGAISLITGGGTITQTAGVSINLSAPSIGLTGSVGLGLGNAAPFPVIGGAPGPSPHLDYLLGIPLLGNPLVRTS